jgi:hypothetical protein
MRRPVLLAGLLTATFVAGACDNGPDTTPTAPSAPTVTETFTHSFSQAAAGQVIATITTVDPSGSIVGFQLGTWNTVTCSATHSNDLAGTLSVLQGLTQSSASLCVRLHDPNGLLTTNPVNYTVTVQHN